MLARNVYKIIISDPASARRDTMRTLSTRYGAGCDACLLQRNTGSILAAGKRLGHWGYGIVFHWYPSYHVRGGCIHQVSCL